MRDAVPCQYRQVQISGCDEMANGAAAMKILSLAFTAAVIACLPLLAMAQTADTANPSPAATGVSETPPSEQGGQTVNPQSNEGGAEPPVAQPPESEAEKAARVEKIRVLQAQVDDCNYEFMGLPEEHEECIQKVRDQIAGEKPGDDSSPEEKSNE
jgi:hypothetical protein